METSVANDEDINNHLQLIQLLRANSASVSKRAEQKMVESSLSVNPPASYSLGEDVLMRRFNHSTSKRKATKSDKWMRFVRGKVVAYSDKSSCYKVSHTIDGKSRKEWFKVSDITSLTYNQECARHQLLIEGIRRLLQLL